MKRLLMWYLATPWYYKLLVHLMHGAVMAFIWCERDTLKDMWNVIIGRDH